MNKLQDKCHPQTIAVCQSRAEGLGLEAVVSDEKNFDVSSDVSGVMIQYPATDGSIHDYSVSILALFHDPYIALIVMDPIYWYAL